MNDVSKILHLFLSDLNMFDFSMNMHIFQNPSVTAYTFTIYVYIYIHTVYSTVKP